MSIVGEKLLLLLLHSAKHTFAVAILVMVVVVVVVVGSLAADSRPLKHYSGEEIERERDRARDRDVHFCLAWRPVELLLYTRVRVALVDCLFGLNYFLICDVTLFSLYFN